MDKLRVGLKARLGIWIEQEVDNPKQSSWIIIQQYLATLLTFLHVKFVTTPGKKMYHIVKESLIQWSNGHIFNLIKLETHKK